MATEIEPLTVQRFGLAPEVGMPWIDDEVMRDGAPPPSDPLAPFADLSWAVLSAAAPGTAPPEAVPVLAWDDAAWEEAASVYGIATESLAAILPGALDPPDEALPATAWVSAPQYPRGDDTSSAGTAVSIPDERRAITPSADAMAASERRPGLTMPEFEEPTPRTVDGNDPPFNRSPPQHRIVPATDPPAAKTVTTVTSPPAVAPPEPPPRAPHARKLDETPRREISAVRAELPVVRIAPPESDAVARIVTSWAAYNPFGRFGRSAPRAPDETPERERLAVRADASLVETAPQEPKNTRGEFVGPLDRTIPAAPEGQRLPQADVVRPDGVTSIVTPPVTYDAVRSFDRSAPPEREPIVGASAPREAAGPVPLTPPNSTTADTGPVEPPHRSVAWVGEVTASSIPPADDSRIPMSSPNRPRQTSSVEPSAGDDHEASAKGDVITAAAQPTAPDTASTDGTIRPEQSPLGHSPPEPRLSPLIATLNSMLPPAAQKLPAEPSAISPAQPWDVVVAQYAAVPPGASPAGETSRKEAPVANGVIQPVTPAESRTVGSRAARPESEDRHRSDGDRTQVAAPRGMARDGPPSSGRVPQRIEVREPTIPASRPHRVRPRPIAPSRIPPSGAALVAPTLDIGSSHADAALRLPVRSLARRQLADPDPPDAAKTGGVEAGAPIDATNLRRASGGDDNLPAAGRVRSAASSAADQSGVVIAVRSPTPAAAPGTDGPPIAVDASARSASAPPPAPKIAALPADDAFAPVPGAVPRSRNKSSEGPPVRVSIGRITVEAPARAAQPFSRPRPTLSLNDYLRRRRGPP